MRYITKKTLIPLFVVLSLSVFWFVTQENVIENVVHDRNEVRMSAEHNELESQVHTETTNSGKQNTRENWARFNAALTTVAQ
jgi:hypothetical protein